MSPAPPGDAAAADSRARLRRGLELALLLAGLGHAWRQRWLAEDAYISLRYARNWARGLGLVFNPGERVEGYTNFLWTALLGLGARAGLDLEALALGLGMLCTAGTLLAWIALARRLVPAPAQVPVGLFALVANYSWACFATSGLELPLLSLLLGLSLCALDPLREPRGPHAARARLARAAAAGALLALAVATRPDALLFGVSAGVLLLAPRAGEAGGPGWLPARVARARLASCAAGFALLYLPFTAWRVAYYGEWLPNTFHVKASAAWWSQGGLYLWELLRRYSLWAYAPLALWALWRWLSGRARPDPLVAALVAYAALHTLYVVRIGGDFMEARFLAVLLPFAYLLLERGLRAALRAPWLRGAALASLVLTSAFSPSVLPVGAIRDGITDERSWAPYVQLWKRAGAVFGEELPRDALVATDAIGAFGYASDLPLLDVLGLVDPHVARQPLARRSRPGHEKLAPIAYLEQREAALLRIGSDLYALSGPPSLVLAGDRYYLLSPRPEIEAGFARAVARLEPLAAAR